ncbi:MAG: hypothetical protein HY235_00410 [Acidobacteria bacterium]|nr:hypothetical protein [Acidobacteriota bacterium]
MAPILLFPETVVEGGGRGPVIDLGSARGKPLQLTLIINRMMEQQTLDLAVCGSGDGSDWSARPIMILPHKYYCGTYYHVVDLSELPDARFLRVDYQVHGWAHPGTSPVSCFSVWAEPAHEGVLAAAR